MKKQSLKRVKLPKNFGKMKGEKEEQTINWLSTFVVVDGVGVALSKCNDRIYLIVTGSTEFKTDITNLITSLPRKVKRK